MKSLATAAVLFGLAASAPAAVDPTLLTLVMPDAKILTGIQIDSAQASPFGQYLLSQIGSNADFDKIIAATGFDPRRDLREMLAATADGQSGLILGRGTFQPDRIAAAAVLAGAATSNYRGIEVLSNAGNSKPGSIAFLDTSTVAIGNTDAVKAAIDRRIAGTAYSGPLGDKANAVSAVNDAWFATVTPPSSLLSGAAVPNLNQIPLDAAQQVSGGVKFAASGVTLSAEVVARSNQDAQALVDVGKFVAGLVQTNRNTNPGATKAATLADAASFSANGSTAVVTISLPEQQVEQLFMPARPSGAGRARRIATPR